MADATPSDVSGRDRRTAVLQSALQTFARHGYRRTSMDQVARDADISRPGLYFLFATKEALFREAVERCLQDDLAAAEEALAGPGPLSTRLLSAFDHWAGRYVGPLTRDVAAVVADNPDLQGPLARSAPDRFAALVVDAITEQVDRPHAKRVAQTLLSTSIGIKHQVDDRRDYLRRLTVAVDLLLGSPAAPAPRGGGGRTRSPAARAGGARRARR